jgi:hypothetical protein
MKVADMWRQVPSKPNPRVPGKRGRLPVSPKRLALRFVHEYATLPEVVYPVDVTEGITEWGMLGNGPDPTCTVQPDGVGDCTFAGRQHYRMAKAARGHEIESWETSNQLVEEYLAYNNGADVGANIANLLLDWFQAGKILAFAPVDHTDRAKFDAALEAFTGVYCGVNLTDDADDLFSNHHPWTVADGQQPNPQEGHCIVLVSADGHSLDGYITWGADQQATRDWSAACVEEAWVIITQEDVDNHQLDIAALTADIEALGGTAKKRRAKSAA